jgi:hypothetical protein
MHDGELRFRFADVQRELREMERLSRGFLHRESVGRLTQSAEQLEYMRLQRRGGEWGIRQDAPVLTKPTQAYEAGGRRGRHMIQAAIDSTWGIVTEDPTTFRVTGNVSTRVRLIDGEDGPELARWRAEHGREGAPGCFFHTQIRGQAEDRDPPWPHSVPVPRFPSPFLSIAAVLGFVLGELFQTEWAQHVSAERSERLAADQRRQWERRLRWELELIRRRRTLPWAAVKAALPHRDLFLPDPDPEVFSGG